MGYDIIKSTPFGNSLTTDFALAALKGESLGSDKITDFSPNFNKIMKFVSEGN